MKNKLYISILICLTPIAAEAANLTCPVSDYSTKNECIQAMQTCTNKAAFDKSFNDMLHYQSYFSNFATLSSGTTSCPNTTSGTCKNTFVGGCAILLDPNYPNTPEWNAAKAQLTTVANGVNQSPAAPYPFPGMTQPIIICTFYCSKISSGQCQVNVPSTEWDCSSTQH